MNDLCEPLNNTLCTDLLRWLEANIKSPQQICDVFELLQMRAELINAPIKFDESSIFNLAIYFNDDKKDRICVNKHLSGIS